MKILHQMTDTTDENLTKTETTNDMEDTATTVKGIAIEGKVESEQIAPEEVNANHAAVDETVTTAKGIPIEGKVESEQIAPEEVNANHAAEGETTKDMKDQVVAEATVGEIISTTL